MDNDLFASVATRLLTSDSSRLTARICASATPAPATCAACRSTLTAIDRGDRAESRQAEPLGTACARRPQGRPVQERGEEQIHYGRGGWRDEAIRVTLELRVWDLVVVCACFPFAPSTTAFESAPSQAVAAGPSSFWATPNEIPPQTIL